MDKSASSFFKSALTNGAILGVIMVVISLLMWMFNYLPLGIGKGILNLLGMTLIYIVALYLFTKSYRDTLLDGSIRYGRAFLYGLAVMVICSLVSAVFTYVLYKFIDPEYPARILKSTIAWTEGYMTSKGIPESTISSAIDKVEAKGALTAVSGAISAIKSGVIFGVICSLISSAFAKKEGNPLKEN